MVAAYGLRPRPSVASVLRSAQSQPYHLVTEIGKIAKPASFMSVIRDIRSVTRTEKTAEGRKASKWYERVARAPCWLPRGQRRDQPRAHRRRGGRRQRWARGRAITEEVPMKGGSPRFEPFGPFVREQRQRGLARFHHRRDRRGHDRNHSQLAAASGR